MIVIFDLIRSGVVSDPTSIKNIDGIELSSDNITTILALIATRYIKDDYETVHINSKYLNSITDNYKLYIEFLKEKDVINFKEGDNSTAFQFTNNFKKFAIISDIIVDKFDESQGKIQNKAIPIINETDQKLFKDFYDIEVIYKPIKKQILIEPDIYDFKLYMSTFFNFKRIVTGDMYYNWRDGKLFTPFTYCSKEAKLCNFKFDEDNLVSLKIPSSAPLFLAIWCIIMGINKDDYDFKNWCTLVKKGNDKNGKSFIYKEIRKKLDKIKDSDGEEIKYENVNLVSKKERKHFSYIEAINEFKKWINIKIKPNEKEEDNITNNIFKLNFSSIYEKVDRQKYNIPQEIIKIQTDFVVNKMITKMYEELSGIKILMCHDEIYFQERYLANASKLWEIGLKELYDLLPNSDDNNLGDINYEDFGIYNFK